MTDQATSGHNQPMETYEDFFPYYLREHSKPETRAFHYVGTGGLVATIIAAIAINPWLFLLVPMVGYGFAWVSHFFIEKNKPATFDYPGWSLRGDFHMTWLFLTGRLKAALEKAGVN